MLKQSYITYAHEGFSIPSEIKNLLNDDSNINIQVISYDYIGDAKEEDYEYFADKVYDLCANKQFTLVMYSNHMEDTSLIRKTFKFDLTDYAFTNAIRITPLSVDNRRLIFIGILVVVR